MQEQENGQAQTNGAPAEKGAVGGLSKEAQEAMKKLLGLPFKQQLSVLMLAQFLKKRKQG
ncbi:hypothetical protein E1162_18335 [Rhodobacteraceae bacterium RKSG542]|uniref:hypothetical protein n=1 Tax=Pseudovibrio flavus TaxID=2529854 RepID=UPI0012BC885E|nr:hypothetical protein [Pseudovibrio flavus]MTI19203.1 hypothetical protein [Pseudovibrio flavus]